MKGLAEIAGQSAGPPDIEADCIRLPLHQVVQSIRSGFPHLSNEQTMAALDYWRTRRDEIQRELDDENPRPGIALHLRGNGYDLKGPVL